jgi:hypothetical protein
MHVATITLDPRIARIHYADYRKRCAQHRAVRREEAQRRANELALDAHRVHIERTRIEKEDTELLKAYRALYRGQQIIDLPKTIGAGGLDDKKLPRLAVCQADKSRHFWTARARLDAARPPAGPRIASKRATVSSSTRGTYPTS